MRSRVRDFLTVVTAGVLMSEAPCAAGGQAAFSSDSRSAQPRLAACTWVQLTESGWSGHGTNPALVAPSCVTTAEGVLGTCASAYGFAGCSEPVCVMLNTVRGSSPGVEPWLELHATLLYPSRRSTTVPPEVFGPTLVLDPMSCRILMFDTRANAEPCAQTHCPQIVSTPPRVERSLDVESESGPVWQILAVVDGDGKVVSAALNDVQCPDQYDARETDLIEELIRIVQATRFRRTDDKRASPLTLVVAFEITREDDGVVRIGLREYCTEWRTTFTAVGRDGVFGEWKERK